jgi:hypothetical protein
VNAANRGGSHAVTELKQLALDSLISPAVPVGVVQIDNPEQDGRVAEVLQDGYVEIDGGKVVVPARIRLHRCLSD